MVLSSSSTNEGSPDNPSSSSNFLHLTNSSDELGQSHNSSFNIRDFTFSRRSKDIKKNWPFSPTSLELCLKHGVTDLLPPIEPRGSVVKHSSEASSSKKPPIAHGEGISGKGKGKLEKLGSNHAVAETKQGFENASLASGSKSKVQEANVSKTPRKKCGLVEKPGACVDSAGSKEDQGCLFTASESMALGTCPICKTFSSASNTTLNAHIDQCLSVDLGQQPVSKPSKPRVKPRMKVKTMVDIYATSKECTLEDLDKRNGTKWAAVSSSPDQVVPDKNKPEGSNTRKKRSVLRAPVDEDAAGDGIGPVYIDAKGQKLRIISECKEKASDPSGEHEEDVSEKKSSSEGKGNYKNLRKRGRGKKSYKQCKEVPQSRKHAARKGNASEVPENRGGDSEEGRSMERSETPGPSQRRLFNQRMVTKRLRSRSENKKGRNTCDQPSETGQSLSADPLVSRGPSHPSVDLSETVSSALNSQNSWRSCGESQVSGKITKSPRSGANPLRCSMPVDKAYASKGKGVLKLKKARLDFLENEEEDEDSGRWESEMTQERELTDYDDWDDSEETVSGEDDDYESWEETGNNKGGDDMLDKTDNADAEFERMMYEKTSCETAERGGSSFMEVDPIPIPGPPGSFLQSPWDMGTDTTVHHGNFSAITSQVQSSLDQLDLTDRNSSESPVSAISNIAAPETQTFSFHKIITADKGPSGLRDNEESCSCQRKEKALEDTTTFKEPAPHMVQRDLDLFTKSVPAAPSNSNSVLRLMGKDLMVINHTEETSHGDSSPKPTSRFQDLSKTQQMSPPGHHLHRPYGGNGLSFDTSTSSYNIP